VSDVGRALEFYRDCLGFEVVTDLPYGPDWRWVALARSRGETELVLFRPSRTIAGDQADELEKRIGTWTGIVLLTDDIDDTYQTLRERGVEFHAPPRQRPWGGCETSFSDPDGNHLYLAQRPATMS